MKIIKKNILLISFLLLAIFYSKGQNYSIIKTIDIEANNIEVDKFGSIYIVEDFKITKLNTQGDILYIYDQIENGHISNLDVSNPLKPIIFYKDDNVLVLLDKKLSIINSIDLHDKGFSMVEIIANANGDNYWLFSEIDYKLTKVDKAFNVVYQSESFLDLFNQYKKPLQIIEKENSVYILVKNEIKIFDTFGVLKQNLHFKDVSDFQVFNNKIIYKNNTKMESYNILSLQTQEMIIPKTNTSSKIKLINDKLVVLGNEQLIIYTPSQIMK